MVDTLACELRVDLYAGCECHASYERRGNRKWDEPSMV
jgi:hypothetical protein